MHLPSVGHDSDFQDVSICQFENNGISSPELSLGACFTCVLSITLPLNSQLGKTPNCLFIYFFHYMAYAFSLPLGRIICLISLLFLSPHPLLLPSLPPFLSCSAPLSCLQMSVVFIKWMGFLRVCWAHWRILMSGFSPLIAITSVKEIPPLTCSSMEEAFHYLLYNSF